MQNPKTGGNRFNPDIRPSEISTYTETNGEQTAEYKIVNAHPIINGILNKLAFFRTHAAAVWYNRLANKTVKQKFDDVDAAVGQLNEKLVVKGNIKSFYIEGGTEYPLILRGAKELSESGDFYQFVMRESGGHFGKQVNGEWTTIWEIATKLYVDDRKANIVNKGWAPSITLDKPHGTITVSYSDLYIVWVAGNPGAYEFHIKSITDGELNIVSFNQETGIVTLATKSGNNAAFTYVGS